MWTFWTSFFIDGFDHFGDVLTWERLIDFGTFYLVSALIKYPFKRKGLTS